MADFLTADKSTLDLMFSNEPNLVCNVQDLGSFGSSDHKLLYRNLDTDVGIVNESKTRLNYNQMNVNGMKDEIRLINSMSILTDSVHDCWESLRAFY